MDQLLAEALELQKQIGKAVDRLGIDKLERRKSALDKQSNDPALWQNNNKAQNILRERAGLEARLEPWRQNQSDIKEIIELIKLGDPTLKEELTKKLESRREVFEAEKFVLKFSEPYDDHDAILSLYAGAGGTDAQDWTQMLLRMYVRWAEKSGLKVTTLEESTGDEAGLKSVTIEIDGPFAYGKLRGEHGVHRLVRLSPFNADHLRQTSFAKVEAMPKVSRPDELELDYKDLRVDVFRSGGHGGQSVNTTDSAVRVTHIPTGISVAIQNERSQLQNKETALTVLRSRLAGLQLEQHKEKLSGLKGPNQSAEWGNQIRSYVLHPYKQVKDLRTKYETSDVDGLLNGNLDDLISAYLDSIIT